MRIKRITATLLIGLLFTLTACASPAATPPPKASTSPPNLTAQQAQGIVVSAIQASTLIIRQSSCYFKTDFNYSNRQWMVTVWASEENSKIYAGAVYIVDDATAKLLNPPPVFTPK
jgi:hypothetical protein